MKPDFAQMLMGQQAAVNGGNLPATPQATDNDDAILQQIASDVQDIKQMLSQLTTEEQNEEGGEANA